MKTDKKMISTLNAVLKNQLTGINQYFLHARMFGNWGLDELNHRHYRASIKLMKNADEVIERILFLEGLPNLQNLGKLNIGESVPECLAADLKFEHHTVRTGLLEAIKTTEEHLDFVSAEMLRELLESCEKNIDELETQLSLIASLGLPNYLQSQMKSIKDE